MSIVDEIMEGIPHVTRNSRLHRRLRNRARRGNRKRFKMKYAKDNRKHGIMKDVGGRKYFDGLTKQMCNDDIEDFKGEIKNEFFLAASSLNDHHITKLVAMRTENGLSTVNIKQEIVTTHKDWDNYLSENWLDCQIIQYGSNDGLIVDGEMNFFDYSLQSSSAEIKMYGSRTFVEKVRNSLLRNFKIATCHIEWIYGQDGSSVNIPLLGEKLPITEMYPFLGDESVENYYDRFLDSDASILLLIGPPGTGKTTFIRGLLHYAKKNAMVTYDDKILERDYVFARFIEDDSDVMVIEDADNFLKSRAEGNTMMHRFLNVGDGLISMKGKKLIFSTNLPSVRDVDSALIRPGRCFDIVTFDNYTLEQAQKLAGKLGLTFEEKESKNDKYSLAEIFHKQKNVSPKQTSSFGFI